jgi:hypothetical protein
MKASKKYKKVIKSNRQIYEAALLKLNAHFVTGSSMKSDLQPLNLKADEIKN